MQAQPTTVPAALCYALCSLARCVSAGGPANLAESGDDGAGLEAAAQASADVVAAVTTHEPEVVNHTDAPPQPSSSWLRTLWRRGPRSASASADATRASASASADTTSVSAGADAKAAPQERAAADDADVAQEYLHVAPASTVADSDDGTAGATGSLLHSDSTESEPAAAPSDGGQGPMSVSSTDGSSGADESPASPVQNLRTSLNLGFHDSSGGRSEVRCAEWTLRLILRFVGVYKHVRVCGKSQVMLCPSRAGRPAK